MRNVVEAQFGSFPEACTTLSFADLVTLRLVHSVWKCTDACFIVV